MANIPVPATKDEMLYQVWFALIGSNGDGIASRVRKLDERVGHIEDTLPTLWSREDHECAEREYAEQAKAREAAHRDKAERRKLSRRDWIVISISAVGVGVSMVALIGGIA